MKTFSNFSDDYYTTSSAIYALFFELETARLRIAPPSAGIQKLASSFESIEPTWTETLSSEVR